MPNSILRGALVRVLVFCMLGATLQQPAVAAMVGTEQLAAGESRAADAAVVEAFLARDEVRQQLERWGVAPELAAERAAALSDAELQTLVQHIEQQPAGGDALAIIGIVFLVLLILELVGVINVFNRI